MAFDKTLLVDLSGAEGKEVKRLFEKGITIPRQARVLKELLERMADVDADVRALARNRGLARRGRR